jgi:hypothetical protein
LLLLQKVEIMINEKIETAIHQDEVAAIEDVENTAHYRAACIKNAAAALVVYSETLRLASLGKLTVSEPDIFGGVQSVEEQVTGANIFIKRSIEILARYA